MNRARVTVCIPAYDRPEFLREALESLCDQGLGRDEYVVAISDDASPTSLNDVVSSFEGKLQIEYQRNSTNLGHIANFEKAFSLAKTRYVSFLPHDDLISPGQLGRALAALDNHSGAVLVASLSLVQRYPGAMSTSLHGIGILPPGSATANYSEPYVWGQTEWMALALATTPLCMVGSVFHAETFNKCQSWKSFPLWHDRLMLAEMALHGRVISLPWIGGYYRVSDSQLSRQIWNTHAGQFVEASKFILRLCESANIPVIEFWIGRICKVPPKDRAIYLRMLSGALTSEVFKSMKRECEKKLGTRLHLGGRLDKLGVPRPVAEFLRAIDRFLTERLG